MNKRRAVAAGTKEFLQTLLTNVIAAATALGACLYAMFWFGYRTYYAAFGLRPDDVGISEADIVTTAAVGLALFAALLAPVAAFWWAVTGFVRRPGGRKDSRAEASPEIEPGRPFRWSREGLWDHRTRFGVTFAVLLPVCSLVFNNFVFRPPYVFLTAGFVAAIVGATLLSATATPSWAVGARTVLAWSAAAGIVFLCAASFLAYRTAGLADDLLRDGRTDSTFFVFKFRDDPVCVEVGPQRQYYRFMGSGSAGMVVFDPTTHHAIRLADPNASVEFLPSRAVAC